MNVKRTRNQNFHKFAAVGFLRLIAEWELLEQIIISKGLGEAIEEWLLDLKIEGRSMANIRFYRQNLEPFGQFVEAKGTVDLKSLRSHPTLC